LWENKEFVDMYDICEKEVNIEKTIGDDNFKGILDLYDSFSRVGADLKTGTTDLHEIARQIFKFNYDIQYYMYSNLADLDDFFFIFQETEYPYYSRIVKLDEEWRDTGEKKTLEAYQKYIKHYNKVEIESPALQKAEVKRLGYMTFEEETDHPAIQWDKAIKKEEE